MIVETTVSRQVLEQVADGFHQLIALKAQQQATQAEMIRGCVAAIRREPRGHFDWQKARDERKQIEHERALALLHLEWLATQLENEAGVDLGEPTVTITKA